MKGDCGVKIEGHFMDWTIDAGCGTERIELESPVCKERREKERSLAAWL